MKRTILVAVLLVACILSATVGGTVAWFTDKVETGLNIIEAGNLDIEVYKDEIKAENKIDGATDVFEIPELWEPGVVSCRNVILANEGNLHLNYLLSINPSGENYVVDAEGKRTDYDLTDVLKVAMIEGGADVEGKTRAEVLAMAKAANGTALKDAVVMGSLAPEGEQNATATYALVVYWEPTAEDNNWNVNNGKSVTEFNDAPATALNINLGVNVLATQEDVEIDSFGPDYDANGNVQDIVGSDSSISTDTPIGHPAYMFSGNGTDPMNKKPITAKTLAVINETPAQGGQMIFQNLKATVEEGVVVNAEAGVWFIDCELIVPEGGYIAVNNSDGHMGVYFANTTINGVLVDESNYYSPEIMKYIANKGDGYVETLEFTEKYNWTNTSVIATEDNKEELTVEFPEGYIDAPMSGLYITGNHAKDNVASVDCTFSTILLTDVVAEVDNVVIIEEPNTVVIINSEFTLPEDGKLVVNNSNDICQVMMTNVKVNGEYLDGDMSNPDVAKYFGGTGSFWVEALIEN